MRKQSRNVMVPLLPYQSCEQLTDCFGGIQCHASCRLITVSDPLIHFVAARHATIAIPSNSQYQK